MRDEVSQPYKIPKILVVEDDNTARLTLCSLLQDLGCWTLEASNGYWGVKQFKSERPDVIITDILMPDMEGLATVLQIRALDPCVRIVAMSTGESIDKDYLERMDEIRTLPLKKPFTREDLARLLGNLNIPAWKEQR